MEILWLLDESMLVAIAPDEKRLSSER